MNGGATLPTLETRALCKSFGALDVTRDVTLSLEPGARHALIGPNGAGKTTLINLIAGSLAPSAGDVFVHGECVTHLPQHHRVKRGLVRTFQINKLFRSLSVIENVVMALGERDGLARNILRQVRAHPAQLEEAMAIMVALNLDEVAYEAIAGLPYGKLRLVEVAIALALRPKVLLLDEPAAGVSSSESHLITDAIASLPDDITVLIIEHNMDVVFRFADRITVLDAGQILATGTPEQIAQNDEVKARYLGQGRHG